MNERDMWKKNASTDKEIELNYTGLVEEAAKFSFTEECEGQGNFILIRCAHEGIRADYNAGEVMLYARRKIPQFCEIVKESRRYFDIPSPKVPDKCVPVKSGRSVIAVLHNGTAYTTEAHIRELQFHVFTKTVPRMPFYKIFNGYSELVDHLMGEGVLI